MKYNRPIASLEQLNFAAQAGFSEVLLEHHDLARLGTLNNTNLEALAQAARQLDLKPVLVWDILMTNATLIQAQKTLQSLNLKLFSAIRVQDPGAFEYVLKQLPQLAVQLILETGNHNLKAVTGWCNYAGPQLERVVLSIELPQPRLSEYITALHGLNIQVEVLGLGPILLLYTPRSLLATRSSIDFTEDQPWLRAWASSEESVHKNFRVIENQHGTFLFHEKDYCLIDKIGELAAMKLDFLRVEVSENLENLASVLKDPTDVSKLNYFMSNYQPKVTRCFYQANATDVLFKKLKNTVIQRNDQNDDRDYIGEVVESSKDHYLIVRVQGQNLLNGAKLKFINPKGEVIFYQLQSLTNLDQQPCDRVEAPDFAVLPYIRKTSPKTLVYFNRDL